MNLNLQIRETVYKSKSLAQQSPFIYIFKIARNQYAKFTSYVELDNDVEKNTSSKFFLIIIHCRTLRTRYISVFNNGEVDEKKHGTNERKRV